MTDEFDVIVLGAGPTGENVAERAVRGGLIPAGAGSVGGVAGAGVDPAEVLARRDSFASNWTDDGQVKWLAGAGIALFRGNGGIAGGRGVGGAGERRTG